MITPELVHAIIERLAGDRNAYRIASYLQSQGHLGPGDMHAIRDILGEAHPDMRGDGKEREPKGRRQTSQNRQVKHEGTRKNVKAGGAA